MLKGTITFRAAFPGTEFGPIERVCHQSVISRATIESSPGDGVSLMVEIAGADSIDAALAEAGEVAAQIAKVLTFKLGEFYHEFGLFEHALVEEQPQPDGSTKPLHQLGSSIGLMVKTNACKTLGPQQQAEVKVLLEKIHHHGFLHYDLFRAALGLSDPLSKFMALYNIVLSTCSDNQENVDKFVISIQPKIPTNPPHRPRRSGVQETVYSRLRNQVGHIRPGTTIEGTRAEMEVNLSGLVEVTKELISRQS